MRQRYKILFSIVENRALFSRQISLLVIFSLFTATVFAQSNPVISFDRSPITVAQTLDIVRHQTGIRFSFDTDFDTSKEITLPKTKVTLTEVMELVVKGTERTYVIGNKSVVIRRPKAAAPTPITQTQKEIRQVVSPLVETTKERIVEIALESTTKLEVVKVENRPVIAPLVADLGGISDDVRQSLPAALQSIRSPRIALKTNLLLLGTTSPNLGLEIRLTDKLTLDLPVSFNPWTFSDNILFRHILVQPELRYWSRESFNGHFFGVNLTYALFNKGGVKLPFGMIPSMEEYRYEGNLYSIGVSYGYQWMLSNRLSMEATVGVGYAYLDYDKFPCAECGRKISHETKHYFGPTKLGVSLIYFIK